jgi:hypothetical protein
VKSTKARVEHSGPAARSVFEGLAERLDSVVLAITIRIRAEVPGYAVLPWTTIYSTTTGTDGVQSLAITGTGRYVRMYGTQRATQYGYSLWEFQVFGS